MGHAAAESLRLDASSMGAAAQLSSPASTRSPHEFVPWPGRLCGISNKLGVPSSVVRLILHDIDSPLGLHTTGPTMANRLLERCVPDLAALKQKQKNSLESVYHMCRT